MMDGFMKQWIRVAVLAAFLFAVCIGGAQHTLAADGGKMTLTVTPPLFQLSLQPGESWTSGIQVVNGNPYDVTVYADPVLFEPVGETGRPNFIEIADDSSEEEPSTLAGWITLPHGAHKILREETHIIPITLTVPENAAPGGHYAAILIGNTPPTGTRTEGAVSVTSSIASLIFLRVAGDVDESGKIKDFATEKSVYEHASARLSLRFENTGNVHIQPQGDITIFNMFGKQRGYIPVNHANGYGNVLPGSVRRFTFTWESQSGWWDIGRYRAEATVGFGADTKSFVQAATYFWVLPIVPLLQVLGATIGFFIFLGWALRSYVRRALALEAQRQGIMKELDEQEPIQPDLPDTVHRQQNTIGALVNPIAEGMVDLRRVRPIGAPSPQVVQEDVAPQTSIGVRTFIYRYRYFFLFMLVCIGSWFAVRVFLTDVTAPEREYRAIEERPDGSTVDLMRQ